MTNKLDPKMAADIAEIFNQIQVAEVMILSGYDEHRWTENKCRAVVRLATVYGIELPALSTARDWIEAEETPVDSLGEKK